MKTILIAASLLMSASFASARELDNDSAYANQQSLKGTVVVRVKQDDKSVAYLKTSKVPGSESEAKVMAQNKNYRALPAQNLRSELDQDGGVSSWYWYPGYNYNYYSYSSLYWYGNSYQPCYYYTYGGYSYYYYSSYRYGWW